MRAVGGRLNKLKWSLDWCCACYCAWPSRTRSKRNGWCRICIDPPTVQCFPPFFLAVFPFLFSSFLAPSCVNKSPLPFIPCLLKKKRNKKKKKKKNGEFGDVVLLFIALCIISFFESHSPFFLVFANVFFVFVFVWTNSPRKERRGNFHFFKFVEAFFIWNRIEWNGFDWNVDWIF